MVERGRYALLENEVQVRRELILTATLDRVAERGLSGTRLKDVAATAQVSVGTVQHYFDSRDELVLSAFRLHSEHVIARVNAAGPGSGSAWEGMRRMFREFLSVENFDRRTRLWVEFVAEATRDARVQQLIDEIFSTWRRVLRGYVEAGVADGTFKPRVSPDIAADALLAQMDGLEIARAIQAESAGTARLQHVLDETAAVLLGVRQPDPTDHPTESEN